MRGRVLCGFLFACLAIGALAQARSAFRVMRSSRIVHTIESTSLAAARAGAEGLPLLRANLTLAREAVELDASSVAAAQALGSVYLLLGRPQEAISGYEKALRLQPTAELYMNLGHAALAKSDVAAAHTYFLRAAALDSRLAEQVPSAAR
ncbi:MAG: tetratricopeptide repeat protein [Acidobacteriota bacterium]